MGTTNKHHRMHRKEVFWQHHIDCWSQTMLTQAHYCLKNDLSQSDFSKWKKKLKPYAKRRLSKRPFALENKNAGNNYILRQKANRCSFCSYPPRKANKLFYGQDDLVAICDYCLWHKAQKLHQEVKYYKTIHLDRCSVCLIKNPDVSIGNVCYQICEDCLLRACSNIFHTQPEKNPCRNTCICCMYKNPEQYLEVGTHIICHSCLILIFKRFVDLQFDVNRCSFCQEERTEIKQLHGKDRRWICENCAEAALANFRSAKQTKAAKGKSKHCNLCGIEKQNGKAFIASNKGQVCEDCIHESHALLIEKN